MPKVSIEMKCEKCGKPQKKNEKQSNENWSVFNTNETCECGGKFCMFIDGKKVG